MKKILLNSMAIGLWVLPVVVLAQAATAPNVNVMNALDSIVNWLFAILLVIAALFIIIAAYDFVTASGDPEKATKARNFVMYAVIGVMIAFLAKGLVYLVGTIVNKP